MKYMPLGEHLCYVWVQHWTLQAFRTGSNICFITVVSWNCSCNGHILSCPSSTHALGVIQWKMEYKIPRMYHCMFRGYGCIDCMFWGYWWYLGAEHHIYLWEKWVTHWEIRHPDVRRKELPRSHQCSQERDVHQLIWGDWKESSDKGSSTRKHFTMSTIAPGHLPNVCHI